MTNQLTGRALDEACAKAMGWKHVYWEGPNLMAHNDKDWLHCIARPSADAACIPEMLAWLRSKTYIECDGCPLPLEVVDLGNEYEASIGAEGDDIARVWAHGDTISEALAKLVVAVGEAQE